MGVPIFTKCKGGGGGGGELVVAGVPNFYVPIFIQAFFIIPCEQEGVM